MSITIFSKDHPIENDLRYEESKPMHGVEYFHVKKVSDTPNWPKFVLGTCLHREEQVLQECLKLSDTERLYRFIPSTKGRYSVLILGSADRPRAAFEITRLDAFRAKLAEAQFPQRTDYLPGYMMTTQYVNRDDAPCL